MSKGYVIVATGENYVRQAYLCALSIKATQDKIANVSLITDRAIDKKFKSAFEHVIVKRVNDSGRFKTKIRSLVYDLTPYEETVVLDSDMLFTSDISSWWDMFKGKDLFFTTTVKTYRGDVTNNNYYRDIFKKFKLPHLCI
jgi:hypothetical protein